MLESLELHSYEWTVKAIKTRECLDKLDRRDIALSTFAMTRNKNINVHAVELRNHDLARAEDNTAELRAEAARNTRLLQVARITELMDDAASIIAETDRAALLSICSMDNTEMLIYLKMVEVYDLARSHFLFEIVEPQVKRFLNAERLKAEALAQPLTLSYTQYRSLLLERTQNSELTQDLLNYILKPREEGCPVYLWVAERISEANLLAVNGLAMSNQAWLAYTIAFITAEERLVLQVPSLQERSLFDNGRGYELTDLEDSINHLDVTTLKPFRQWLPWRVLHSTRGYCGSPGTAGTANGYCRVLWVLQGTVGTVGTARAKVTVGYCGSTRGYCRVLRYCGYCGYCRVLGTVGTAGVYCRVLQSVQKVRALSTVIDTPSSHFKKNGEGFRRGRI